MYRSLTKVTGSRVVVVLLSSLVTLAGAQGNAVHSSKRTSEWGPDDERGAANRVTPKEVIQAARLIRDGTVYPVGRVYEHGTPLFGNRHFSLSIVSSPSGGPVGQNNLVWHDEMFSGEIGQIGTQFDGLGHVGIRVGNEDVFYNDTKRSERNGIYLLENLDLERLSSDKVYEFAFIFSPLRLKGATGSPGNPIAVK